MTTPQETKAEVNILAKKIATIFGDVDSRKTSPDEGISLLCSTLQAQEKKHQKEIVKAEQAAVARYIAHEEAL